MAVDERLLMRVFQSARGKSLGIEDVLERARIDLGMKQQVHAALRSLVKAGQLEPDGKRFRMAPPAPPAPVRPEDAGAQPMDRAETAPPVRLLGTPQERRGIVLGTLTRHRDGFGFIASVHGGDDLFVPPQAMGDALDGDVVEGRVGPGRDGRPVAREVRVVERRRQLAVGTYRQIGGGPRAVTYVDARDETLGQIVVPLSTLAQDGDVVRVRLTGFEGGVVQGVVASRLGLPGDPNVEVLSVAYSEGFSDLYPADTLRLADETPSEVRPEDRVGRRDLTGLDLVTIDGEDARDFDDAVFVERTSRGYRLVVAIADVTHYVRTGDALDREAMRRATSVYFPQHVLPMLPEKLSNGICSLNPGVDRLCMVADMALDTAGLPLDVEVYPAVMRSKMRCTYTQVAALIDGEPQPELEPVADMLKTAAELAAQMTRMRLTRGAIDFDLPESYIRLGADGDVAAIERRPRNAAHRLIEEFMLAANEAVARYFESRDLPTVFRVHGPPKEEKLRAFVEMAHAFGYFLELDDAGRIDTPALNEFLRRVEGKPEQRALNHLLLRSMMQAVYSAENIGHYGLAAPSYLHFTSPIRRYPDLVVHRLLKEHWDRGGRVLPKGEREIESERLETVAAHCSERERAATHAEREIDAFYIASFMRQYVGQRFPGIVASVAEFGVFVELQNPYAEGLIRAESLGETSRFDPNTQRLVFGSGRALGIGDAVEIEVEAANPVTRRIDFSLVGGLGVERPPKATRPPRRRDAGTAPKEERPRGARKPAASKSTRGERPPPKGGAPSSRRGSGRRK